MRNRELVSAIRSLKTEVKILTDRSTRQTAAPLSIEECRRRVAEFDAQAQRGDRYQSALDVLNDIAMDKKKATGDRLTAVSTLLAIHGQSRSPRFY